MKHKKILIWSNSISDLFDGHAYGIGVQLYFWAQMFVKHSWQVVAFTPHKSFTKEGILFKHTSHWGKLEIIHEWLSVVWNLTILHPQLVIYRGAGRKFFPLVVITRLLKVKLVLFSASDTDFEIGNELIAGGSCNRMLWQKAIRKTKNIIVQNQYQKNTLQQNYGKVGKIICNIWGKVEIPQLNYSDTRIDVVWVANFRRLKRAEWMVNAAKSMPEYSFLLIGGRAQKDYGYYDEIEQKANGLPNLHFLGKKSFAETNAIISQSKIVCCTSTFEGFPNTFLQAWSNDVPVISTVNPSELITIHHLGVIVETEEELQRQIRRLIQDAGVYREIKHNIHDYFIMNHAADTNFNKLISFDCV